MRKAAVIGAGFVGSTLAYSLSERELFDEIVLISLDQYKTIGTAMDIDHSSLLRRGRTRIGDYTDLKDCEFLFVTAGARQVGNDRTHGMEESIRMIKSIGESVKTSGFNGFTILATNPLDVMTYYFQKYSMLPKEKVIGSGTSLDTFRYLTILSDKIHVERKELVGYVVGEHGDTSFPLFSTTTLRGEKIPELSKDLKDDITIEVRRSGFDVKDRQGATYYGIASSISSIVEALSKKEKTIIPVCTVEDDVAISYPCILSDMTVTPIKDTMSDEEKELFQKSKDKIKKDIEHLR